MWLLDADMPQQLKAVLAELGIYAETANARGWGTLANGELLEASVTSGFSCLPARDRLFGVSAAKKLKGYSTFCSEFLDSFRSAWEKTPIVPMPGQVQSWP